MKQLYTYINESLFDNQEGMMLKPVKIHIFDIHFNENTPILNGNLNPKDYVDSEYYKDFRQYVEEEWPAALQSDNEDELFVIMGTTTANRSKYGDIKLLQQKIEKFLGKPVVSSGTRGLGEGYKYKLFYKLGKGGLIVKGTKNISETRWCVFLDNDGMKELGLNP